MNERPAVPARCDATGIDPRLAERVTVVIRSAGERTLALCEARARAQGLPAGNVITIREAPFSRAMREAFHIGIEAGRAWTFCVDADVLLRPDALRRLLARAEREPARVCEVQGGVLDKFFGGCRPAGNHLYRTALLPKVIEAIPEEGVDIRPENRTLKRMAALGHPWRQYPSVVGLHDFEQSFADVFRKCFVQGHKHQRYTELFSSVWRAGAATDDDYRVALEGFARGLAHSGEVRIDIRGEYFQAHLSRLGLEEKRPLDPAHWSGEHIEEILAGWQETEAYRRAFMSWPGQQRTGDARRSMAHAWLMNRIDELGPVRLLPYVLGVALRHAGSRLEGWASGRRAGPGGV